MGSIRKTLTLERHKKICERTANQYLTVVFVSLLMTVLFIKIATWGIIVDDVLWIVAILVVLIFSTWRYLHHRKMLKCINKELKRLEMENAMDARRKFRHRM